MDLQVIMCTNMSIVIYVLLLKQFLNQVLWFDKCEVNIIMEKEKK